MKDRVYVVLWGENSVSREFDRFDDAKRYAQQVADRTGEPADVDRILLDGGGNPRSQGTRYTAKPRGMRSELMGSKFPSFNTLKPKKGRQDRLDRAIFGYRR